MGSCAHQEEKQKKEARSLSSWPLFIYPGPSTQHSPWDSGHSPVSQAFFVQVSSK